MVRRTISSEHPGDGFLPFLEKALHDGIVVYGKSYEITEYYETKKRSGYIIKTEQFQVFLYKSQVMTNVMTELLHELVKLQPSQALYMELNDTTVEGFELWVDDEEARMWTASKKHHVLDAFKSLRIQDTQKKRSKAV